MSNYTIAWIAWIVAFLVIEGTGIVRKDPGATLTEHVRDWFAVRDKQGRTPKLTALVRVRRIALLGFMAWLSVHFLTGGFI